MLEPLAAIASAIFAAVGLLIGYAQWRESQFRKHEVQIWVDECLDCLCKIMLASENRKGILSDEKIYQIMIESFFRASILVERGRILFKNELSDNFGSEKLKAYQGYRPEILDQIMIGMRSHPSGKPLIRGAAPDSQGLLFSLNASF